MVDLEVLFQISVCSSKAYNILFKKWELYFVYKLAFLFCPDILIYLYPSLLFIAISSGIIMFVFLIKKLQEQWKSCFSTSKLQKRKISLKTFQMLLDFFISI